MSVLSPTTNWWVFFLASLILAVTPGPGVLFVIARTASSGLKTGLTSVAAIALGNLGNAICAALGLAAMFKVSSTAFLLIKFAGACYLVYLAVAALRARPPKETAVARAPVGAGAVFRDGVLVALLNPKTALFFAAFLPQFVRPGGDYARQCVALGAIFVLIAACTDSVYAMLTAAARKQVARLRADSRAADYAAAGVYASLGLYAAFSGTNAGK